MLETSQKGPQAEACGSDRSVKTQRSRDRQRVSQKSPFLRHPLTVAALFKAHIIVNGGKRISMKRGPTASWLFLDKGNRLRPLREHADSSLLALLGKNGGQCCLDVLNGFQMSCTNLLRCKKGRLQTDRGP